MGRWRNGRGTLIVEAGERGSGEAAGADAVAGPDAGSGLAVPLEIAASYRARTRGLLGRDGIKGAILLSPANNVHTFRMRFPIDVAYLDRKLRVIAVHTMRPGRLGTIRLRARHVLEAEAGAMAGWGIRRGVRVAVQKPDGQGTGPEASG
ncbi:DUF192 domain-containing protein [Streptomyces sp. TS71-3]|uniref:DUF192 domain-containing protein n=1 Tax=Streptomyces sp. TS71-3 TaxID=2733862 RepID=UPI001B0F06CD|nr:DUF192 domain-containing protein [Streptomyces sp. TS71-3]GHJ35365.1 hypothetical protein Sm713_09740 [Streptomyces sp. TS71-3]